MEACWVWLLPMLFLFLFGPPRFKPSLSLFLFIIKREFKNRESYRYIEAVQFRGLRDVRSFERIYTENIFYCVLRQGMVRDDGSLICRRCFLVEHGSSRDGSRFRRIFVDDMERNTSKKNRANSERRDAVSRSVQGDPLLFLPSVATWLALRGHSSRVHLFRG